jgi:hypothetical protein
MREAVDASASFWDGVMGSDDVMNLATRHVLAFPDRDQLLLAAKLQAAFDVGDIAKFSDALAEINEKFGLDLKVPA